MCVCTYVCIYVHMHIYTFIYIYVYIYSLGHAVKDYNENDKDTHG